MSINADKPHLWKADVETSIDFYNDWFLRFAPATYRRQRVIRTKEVIEALRKTANLTQMTPEILKEDPSILPMLRMVTAPPLARDRLMGLAYANKNLINAMEGKKDKAPRLPSKMAKNKLDEELGRICDVISELADRDLFPWLDAKQKPNQTDIDRAAAVVADRLCGAASDPIIRNAQEKRQLDALKRWLRKRGYTYVSTEAARNPIERATPLIPTREGKKKRRNSPSLKRDMVWIFRLFCCFAAILSRAIWDMKHQRELIGCGSIV